MAVHAPQTTLSQAERPFFVGVDVGGTNIKFGLVDNQGQTIAHARIPTEAELGPADAVQRMADGITNLLRSAGLEKDNLAAVGLATPASVSAKLWTTPPPR